MIQDLASILRKRIVLQRPHGVVDEEGFASMVWEDYANVYASINALSEYRINGNEIFNAMQLITSSPYLFIIRYLDGVTSKMRIKYGNRIFSIKRVINEEERNILLKIIAEESEV